MHSSICYMFMLLFSVWVSGNSIEYEVPGIFTLSGEPFVLSTTDKFDVVTYMTPYCDLMKSREVCINVMDGLFSQMRAPVHYAPHVQSRTAEDFTILRYDVLLELVHRYNYTSYLEIGCFLDEVFSRIRNEVGFAVGVDPTSGGTHRLTSDAFFDQNDESFDLIFVDGDHRAKQTFVDVIHALQVLRPGGTIVIHDCNPHTEKSLVPYRHVFNAYNGDVWKVVPFLRGLEDVEFVTIDIDHGVGVLRVRENRHPLPELLQQQLDMAANYPLEAFTYNDLDNHREDLLRLVSISEFRAWLDEEI